MESIQHVKEALNARSTTTSLEELENRGRKRVKVIKAEHVAQMIRESVERALTNDDRLPKEEIDRLVEASRAEFADVMAERQREQAEYQQAQSDLESTTRRLEAATEQLRSLESDLQEVEAEAEELRTQGGGGSEDLADKDAEIERLTKRISELEARPAQSPQQDAVSAQLLTNMMSELATLKAQTQLQQQAAPQPQAAAQPDTSMLETFVTSMNDRLEQFGKKMGISSAVDAGDVDLSSMFDQTEDVELESNLDSMEVKAKSGTGIAANLERLKKLKGGGA
ncbi:MAG: hypothetical protein AAF196_08355 [Planctomycetota bacterium]